MTPFGVLLTGEDIVQNDSWFFAVKDDALADVEKSIIKIENKHNVKLIGNRMNFTKARKDWCHLTQGQVVFAVSLWKKGISTRYPD